MANLLCLAQPEIGGNGFSWGDEGSWLSCLTVDPMDVIDSMGDIDDMDRTNGKDLLPGSGSYARECVRFWGRRARNRTHWLLVAGF